MTENKFAVGYMESMHKAAEIIGLASAVHYKGSVKLADELNNIEGKNGDVIIETSTKTSYIYSNGNWSPLAKYDTIHHDNERGEDDIPNEARKVRSICSHCGGVLVPNLSSEATICPYCGCANSTFVYESDPEFKKLV